MNKLIITFLCLFLTIQLQSQCDINFGSTAGTISFTTQSGSDIVNASSSGANESSTQSFDIWDETVIPINCNVPGGTNDITFDFEILHAFDQYSVDGIIDPFAGPTHDITQSTSGLRGTIPLGNSSTNESSAADVRGYQITVTFASHISLTAEEVQVDLTSVNTAGETFESASLVFLDASGTPYGTTTYEGYYGNGSAGPTTDNSCTAPVAGTPWFTTGTGVYTIANTGTINNTDPCNPTGDTNGPEDNFDVVASDDAGLIASDPVGGFIFTVYLEDIAASSAPGAETTTQTSFTSTLNGLTILIALPVELVSFEANEKYDKVNLSWRTASEKSNSYFEIERSNDGIDFERIGTIEGNGNSNTMIEYNFEDKNPLNGLNYYRLMQVDFDGKFEYSDVVSIQMKKKNQISIFPTTTNFEISIELPEYFEKGNYQIFNYAGQVLQEGIIDESIYPQSINVNVLNTGTYFIQVKNKNVSEVLRFIKI